MRRRSSAIILAAIALLALAVVPAAEAKKPKRPSITRVKPMRVKVGQRVTIRGRRFSSRRRRNTVIFRDSDGHSAFAKPSRASRRKLVLKVPRAVSKLVTGKRTVRFRLRVVVRRRYSRWTSRRLSPVVLGSLAADGGGAGGAAAACPGDDFDGDLLPADIEGQIGTDLCQGDTDGDSIGDGFEYRSAVDLNNDDYQNPNASLPYPGKRPYPNPLDPGDGGVDYDGDGLGQNVEQRLWKFSTTPATRTLSPLTYSDGLQYSVYKHLAGQGDRRFPALAAAGYSKDLDFVNWAAGNGYRYNIYLFNGAPYDLFDFNLTGVETAQERYNYDHNGNGWLSDDERDEDADGLTNFDENRGRMQPGWWDSCYASEKPYYIKYAGTDPADADSDGDLVRDGADDQDHDDLPNVMELSRIAAFNKFGAAYPHDPLEGSGDDREQGRNCRLSKAIEEIISGLGDPPVYWHQSAYGRVNPFNPCLPLGTARSCNRHPSFEDKWAPFDDSVNWLALN